MILTELLRSGEARLRDAGVEDAWLEAEVLLRHALGLSREVLLARLREPLPPRAQETFEALLRRRLAREPTPYIVGHWEFYGLDLACTPAALIPRPETELLVEYALEWVKGQGSRVRALRIVDVGTGNGAIAVALAVHLPDVRIVGIDVSRPALALARRNAEAHGVADRVAFVQGALLMPLRGRCELIVANLPYVPTQTYRGLVPEIREHEPEQALHAGRRGTALIEELLAQAPRHLRPGGLLLAEHAWNQGKRLREAAHASFPDADIETKRDLARIERMLVVETSAE
ncbi:MAG: protein-(glutamine-N5) methyltransferase, release factor-specific [Chloroflexi bacterium RBG_16_68_14]|nr:MAG: protein-(glutamine-N5) methyltransferase, release factor-specific [Chloroflexi bacterium RBG_16_68_14]